MNDVATREHQAYAPPSHRPPEPERIVSIVEDGRDIHDALIHNAEHHEKLAVEYRRLAAASLERAETKDMEYRAEKDRLQKVAELLDTPLQLEAPKTAPLAKVEDQTKAEPEQQHTNGAGNGADVREPVSGVS